jgi:hypothetical protein
MVIFGDRLRPAAAGAFVCLLAVDWDCRPIPETGLELRLQVVGHSRTLRETGDCITRIAPHSPNALGPSNAAVRGYPEAPQYLLCRECHWLSGAAFSHAKECHSSVTLGGMTFRPLTLLSGTRLSLNVGPLERLFVHWCSLMSLPLD